MIATFLISILPVRYGTYKEFKWAVCHGPSWKLTCEVWMDKDIWEMAQEGTWNLGCFKGIGNIHAVLCHLEVLNSTFKSIGLLPSWSQCSSFLLIHIPKFPSLRSAKSSHAYPIQGFWTEWVRLHWRYTRVFTCLVFCTYLGNMYLLQSRKPNHKKRNAMYNVNPATAKILMNMRKKEEGGLRRGEEKRRRFKKGNGGNLIHILPNLGFSFTMWIFFHHIK